jgi:hypothetical protein
MNNILLFFDALPALPVRQTTASYTDGKSKIATVKE